MCPVDAGLTQKSSTCRMSVYIRMYPVDVNLSILYNFHSNWVCHWMVAHIAAIEGEIVENPDLITTNNLEDGF